MKKVAVLLSVASLSLVVACNSFDVTLYKKDPLEQAAKLRKKAAKLERQAAELTKHVQKNGVQREVINAVNAAGKTILHAVDVRNNCRAAGDLRLHDVTIGGKCTTAGDAKLEHVTVVGNVKTAGDVTMADTNIGGNCTTSGDATINSTTIGGDCMTSGDATLKDVMVEGTVIASGALTVRDCQFKQALTTSGAATIFNTKIGGNMALSGVLKQCEKCSCKALTICPKDNSTMLFKASSLASITVKHGSSSSGWSLFGFKIQGNNTCNNATIVLDDSTVGGDIVFEEVKGTVILRNGAQVVGQVVGGELVVE